ncbi:MAG: DNA translocase FtsK 4TM domain-containing protein [candidate division FCPU426 bacterium]
MRRINRPQRRRRFVTRAFEAVAGFGASRKSELSGFLLCVAAVLLLVALIPRLPNLLGPLGSGLFRITFGLFGLGAPAVPFLLGSLGFARMLKHELHAPSVKAVGWSLLLISFDSLLHWARPAALKGAVVEGLYLGGLVGHTVGGLLVDTTGGLGVWLIALALSGTAVYLLGKEGMVKNAFLRVYERARIGLQSLMTRRHPAADSALGQNPNPLAPVRGEELNAEEVPASISAQSAPAPMAAADRERAADAFLKRRQEIKVSADAPRVNEAASTSAVGADAVALAGSTGSLTSYQRPPVSLLEHLPASMAAPRDYQEISASLEGALASFGVGAKVVEVCPGPTVTRYEISLAPGVKMSRVVTLSDDIALSAKVSAVRIEGPISGKGTLGIEIPNAKPSPVSMRELIETEEFQNSAHKLVFAVGKDIGGSMIFANLAEMPHLMVAGTTGSGKSVCLNGIITSILFSAAPDEVKFLLVDPKRVELTPYDRIPHLIRPVVTNPKEAAGALRLMVEEMESRYKILASAGMRKIDDYNEWVAAREAQKEGLEPMSDAELAEVPKDPEPFKRLPYIVVVVDELADLMMVSANEVESSIARLAQMARGVGIHLVIATQRPSVDVITGVIKANFPSRIAFQVSSRVDSRTILDSGGADALLGKGDMLYSPFNVSKPLRVQGCFLSSAEVGRVVAHVKGQAEPAYDPRFQNIPVASTGGSDGAEGSGQDDPLYEEAVRSVLRAGQASTSVLQRRLKVGYGRAARLLDLMEAEGIIGPPDGNRPRKVLLNPMDYSVEAPAATEEEGAGEA